MVAERGKELPDFVEGDKIVENRPEGEHHVVGVQLQANEFRHGGACRPADASCAGVELGEVGAVNARLHKEQAAGFLELTEPEHRAVAVLRHGNPADKGFERGAFQQRPARQRQLFGHVHGVRRERLRGRLRGPAPEKDFEVFDLIAAQQPEKKGGFGAAERGQDSMERIDVCGGQPPLKAGGIADGLAGGEHGGKVFDSGRRAELGEPFPFAELPAHPADFGDDKIQVRHREPVSGPRAFERTPTAAGGRVPRTGRAITGTRAPPLRR